MSKLVGLKVLIVNEDDPGVKKFLTRSDLLDAKIIKVRPSKEKKLKLSLLGKHNQANAQMVMALGKLLGLKKDLIIKSLELFEGIGRRLELIGEKNGVKVFDDYAHHPTAIKATLAALREKYKKEIIIAVVEPHGYSRTKALLNEYKGAFKDADKVIVGPIFKARDKETFGVSQKDIVKVSGHKDIISHDSFKTIVEFLSRLVKKGDIVLVMGAGKSYLWAREILKKL